MAEPALLRAGAHGHHRVGFAELFFDLVFVFAITQLSHGLLAHLSPLGVAQTALLMAAVWWLWIYTAWVTNWVDPEHALVRLMLFAMMLGGLALAAAIPKAFEGRGMVFAGAYVAMQLGRTTFLMAALWRSRTAPLRNSQRILIWFAASAPLWLGGALLEGQGRMALWAAAVAVDLAGPAMGFRVPGLGASRVQDWAIEGGHMAERCGLFVIIALGESILVTGATMAGMAWTPAVLAAFAVAVTGSIAMWWLYFHRGAALGVAQITGAADPGRLGRLAYTYLHLPIIAGIVVTAVGDEMVLAHPDGRAGAGALFGLVGGPALFLAGLSAFKHALRGWWQQSHLGGLVALALLAGVGGMMSPLALAAAVALVLVVVAALESWAFRRAA
jgi:low temperature requirement protein LtrA